MMRRELIIEYTPNLTRASVIEDGKLCEIHYERPERKKQTESLYLGRVQSVRPSVGAAFVDIGDELNAFLPLSDGSKLRCGDELIVQGSAIQAVDTKGLRITDNINLAGKWLVLIPGSSGVRLSKKIKDPDLREALLKIMEPVCPSGFGVIVRTASGDVTQELLLAELNDLVKLWRELEIKAKGMRNPGVLYEPLALPMRLVRDLGTTLSAVLTDHAECARGMEQAKAAGWLPENTAIQLKGVTDTLLCDVFSIDTQVDRALKKRVWLPCGGYLVFDICEALTVIDVNSGKMTLGRDTESTALRVNLEAAAEIARQIRLRDIGGIIVVDYIDMKNEDNRDLLLREIRSACAQDRSQVTVGGITKFGLVEITRKRKGEQLDKMLLTRCKTCSGQGSFLSGHEVASRALRQLRRMIASGQRGPFLIRCAAGVFAELSGMTVCCEADVFAVSENGRHAERCEIEQLDIGAALPKGAVQLKKG